MTRADGLATIVTARRDDAGRTTRPRADARQVAWAQHAETRGPLQQPAVAGQPVDGLVLDLDATIVVCHLEKEVLSLTAKGVRATAKLNATLAAHPRSPWSDTRNRRALAVRLRGIHPRGRAKAAPWCGCSDGTAWPPIAGC